MTEPQVIPIQREEGFFTHHVGVFDDGRQYAGFLIPLEPDDQRIVAVLHLFEPGGAHIESDGVELEDRVELESWLENRIADSGNPTPGPIRVQLFSTSLLGRRFSLETIDDGEVEYVPLGLVFGPPWTGNILGVKPTPRSEPTGEHPPEDAT